MQEIGQASQTGPDLLDTQIDEAAAELDQGRQHERITPQSSRPYALQGTLLSDVGRLLADLRPGRQSIAGW
ncbi:hypothetical protein [Streptomyces polychromogenes]